MPDDRRPKAGFGQKAAIAFAIVLLAVAMLGSIFAALAFMSQNI